MKFFSAWPAKLKETFEVTGEDLKKKKLVAPKIRVMFFDNPPTVAEIHHNQIYKYIENFWSFSLSNNKKLQYGVT